MTKKTLPAIGSGLAAVAPIPSKNQKSFNSLIAKIEERRASLAEWEVFGVDFNRRYNDEFLPALERYEAVRLEFVQRLDILHDRKGLTKGERQTIATLITHLAAQIAGSTGHPEAMELYRRYSGRDKELKAQAEEFAVDAEAVRDKIESVFGVEIPPHIDLNSPEAVLRFVQEQMGQQGAQGEGQGAHEERQGTHEEARAEYHANRKKSPRQDAAEERARAEEAEVHLSIREVYRKLASALHPDRERDPVERERKAALMQRVNQAYASRSLLDLLEIQLELEHIDQAALDSISEDRLKRWNTILKEQLRGLDEEIAEIKAGYQARCQMKPYTPVYAKTVKSALSVHIKELRSLIVSFEGDLRTIDDDWRLKTWLKEVKWEMADY